MQPPPPTSATTRKQRGRRRAGARWRGPGVDTPAQAQAHARPTGRASTNPLAHACTRARPLADTWAAGQGAAAAVGGGGGVQRYGGGGAADAVRRPLPLALPGGSLGLDRPCDPPHRPVARRRRPAPVQGLAPRSFPPSASSKGAPIASMAELFVRKALQRASFPSSIPPHLPLSLPPRLSPFPSARANA